MGSPLAAFFTLFSLILIAHNTDARPDPGEYWLGIMKDQPMPAAIQGLVHHDQVYASSLSTKKTDCQDSTEAKVDSARDKTFVNDFEPNISVYHDGKEEIFLVKDFEPRPNVSVYHEDKEDKAFVKDFEPRPNVSVYHD